MTNLSKTVDLVVRETKTTRSASRATPFAWQSIGRKVLELEQKTSDGHAGRPVAKRELMFGQKNKKWAPDEKG